MKWKTWAKLGILAGTTAAAVPLPAMRDTAGAAAWSRRAGQYSALTALSWVCLRSVLDTLDLGGQLFGHAAQLPQLRDLSTQFRCSHIHSSSYNKFKVNKSDISRLRDAHDTIAVGQQGQVLMPPVEPQGCFNKSPSP